MRVPVIEAKPFISAIKNPHVFKMAVERNTLMADCFTTWLRDVSLGFTGTREAVLAASGSQNNRSDLLSR